MVAYHVARGRWRVAVGAAVAGVALLVGELLIVGPGTLVGSIGGATADVATYSALHRSWLTTIPDGVWLARLMLLATFVTLATMTWRRWRVNEAMGEGWALCALLLVTPLAWYHYLTWLLPLLVAVFHAALDGTRAIPPGFSLAAITRRLPLVGFALVYGLLLIPGAGEMLVGPTLFVLWGMCGVMLVTSATRSSDTPPSVPALVGRPQESSVIA